jgi:hypothetical protein
MAITSLAAIVPTLRRKPTYPKCSVLSILLYSTDLDSLAYGEIFLAVRASGWVALFTWRLRRYQFPPLPRYWRADVLELAQELAKQQLVLTGRPSTLDAHLVGGSLFTIMLTL